MSWLSSCNFSYHFSGCYPVSSLPDWNMLLWTLAEDTRECVRITDTTDLLMYFVRDQGYIVRPDEQWNTTELRNKRVHRYGEDFYGVEFPENSLVRFIRKSKRDIASAFTAEIVVEERSNSKQKRFYWGRIQQLILAPIIFKTGKIGFSILMGISNTNTSKMWTVDDIEPPLGTDVFNGLHHYALSYDINNGAHLYVDGVLAAKTMPPDDFKYVDIQPGTEEVIRIGADESIGAVIYSVRMSTTAKSAEEIKRSACKLLVYLVSNVFSVSLMGQFQITF